jgi:MerR family mercuric resistance operon transcriptional regulator
MQETDKPFKIGVLSQRARCHIETIRYYERMGLLPMPARTEGGYRLYRLDHLKRLNFIRRGRELGFTLDEIRALFKLADDRGQACGEVRALAAAHLGDVHAKITDLRAMERALKELVARCDDGTLPACPLIEAFFRTG